MIFSNYKKTFQGFSQAVIIMLKTRQLFKKCKANRLHFTFGEMTTFAL